VTITTQAVALANARMGDAVRLRQPESKQEFEAVAAGPKQAAIILSPPTEEAES
jgi:flagella basal body P-ring formation protein FlgA